MLLCQKSIQLMQNELKNAKFSEKLCYGPHANHIDVNSGLLLVQVDNQVFCCYDILSTLKNPLALAQIALPNNDIDTHISELHSSRGRCDSCMNDVHKLYSMYSLCEQCTKMFLRYKLHQPLFLINGIGGVLGICEKDIIVVDNNDKILVFTVASLFVQIYDKYCDDYSLLKPKKCEWQGRSSCTVDNIKYQLYNGNQLYWIAGMHYCKGCCGNIKLYVKCMSYKWMLLKEMYEMDIVDDILLTIYIKMLYIVRKIHWQLFV